MAPKTSSHEATKQGELFESGDDTLPGHEFVTQYGRVPDADSSQRFTFRNTPRAGTDRGGLSLQRGKATIPQMTELVAKQAAGDRDRVRSTSVSALRENGFVVRIAPTKRNPRHVRAELPDDEVWTDEWAAAFDSSFDDEKGGD